jgi:hypothetical protein
MVVAATAVGAEDSTEAGAAVFTGAGAVVDVLWAESAVGMRWVGVVECDRQASLAVAVHPLIVAVRPADPADFPPDVRPA